MRAALLEETADSMNGIAGVVGVGAMLLLAGQAMLRGAFTVGDFTLFTYYLWFTTELPSYLGTFVDDIKQPVAHAAQTDTQIPNRQSATGARPSSPSPTAARRCARQTTSLCCGMAG